MATGSQTIIVSKEEFAAATAESFKESPDHVLVETPTSDSKLAEELLGIEQEGTFPSFTCRFAKGAEYCSKCNRQFSILDFMVTALKVHSKEFLVHHVLQIDKYFLTRGERDPTCYNCGEIGRSGGYRKNGYSCVEVRVFEQYAGAQDSATMGKY